jgi:putative ATP-binding cassette transporter
MKLLVLLIRSSWLAGLFAAVLGAASGVATLALIALIHQVLAAPNENSLVHSSLFVGACLVVLVTQCGAKFLLVRLSQSTAARLRYELCTRIVAAPLPQLEAMGEHRLLATLNDDVNAITHALTGLPDVCAGAMVLFSGLIYLAFLSLPLSLACVTIGLLGTLIYFAVLRLGDRYLCQAREDQDEVYRQTRDMIHGLRELKSNYFRCLDFVFGVMLPADSRMRAKLITGTSIQAFAHSWGRLFLFVGIGLLIFVSPKFWPNSTAVLTGFTLTILYLTYPLDGILGWLPAMNAATISIRKINRLGLGTDEHASNAHSPVMPPFETLELRGVTYEYASPDGRSFTLGPINFTITAGEELFIAGGNGSGKTTLVKLLTGLYVPRSGQILLNGQVVTNRTRNSFRQLFATVFVEGHIFDRLLGKEVNREELRYWAGMLGIESKVNFETGRLQTAELSRGQHKRLALLVACLDDRPIFVFDEWAAEQDPVFKDVFYRTILPELLRRGKTAVAITHDDRYFSAADRVLTLLDGRLATPAKGAAA